MTEHRRPALALATATIIALAMLVVASCGVPLDSSPRAITRTTIAGDEIPPTTSASPGAAEVSVYFLREDRLEEVRYPVSGEPSLSAAVAFALASPAEGSPAGLTTAVPPGTELRNSSVTDGVATLDLSSEINDISGENQKQAFAQIVFTALSIRGIDAVRFSIQGKAVDAPTDHGNLGQVTADDYDPPLNPR